MKITDALKKYRVKKANIEATLARIAVYQEVLKSDNLHLLGYYTKRGIELGMPKAHHRNSPVEYEAFRIDEEIELTRELVQEWIDEEYANLWMVRIEVSQIEAALNALTRQERFIIELRYMDNISWYRIELSYIEQFREQTTDRTLQRYNMSAIDKINRILKPFYSKFAYIR